MASLEEETLLSSLLTQGSVASFVDLFYLARRGLAPGEPPEELTVLKSIAASLVAGEAARRAGDDEKLLASLHATGAHYAGAGKPGCAVMFFARALALAREAGSEQRQLEVLRDLGGSEFARGDLHAACERHEERRALALKGGHPAALVEAARDLVAARSLQARASEGAGDAAESLRFYERALEAAKYAGDADMEAELNYSVGRAYAIAGRAAEAVERLGEFVRGV
jgi:tetratricopeptide (TPR) repeat protein